MKMFATEIQKKNLKKNITTLTKKCSTFNFFLVRNVYIDFQSILDKEELNKYHKIHKLGRKHYKNLTADCLPFTNQESDLIKSKLLSIIKLCEMIKEQNSCCYIS